MEVTEAIEIVAKTIIGNVQQRALWENYPEIGEYDWDRVLAKIAELVPTIESGQFMEAYDLLERRASAHFTD